jgi:hypothetical protein
MISRSGWGCYPRTRNWVQVIGLLGGAADHGELAAATLAAAKRSLIEASNDPSLIYTFWLLTQIPQCAKQDDFCQSMGQLNINLPADFLIFDLTAGLSDAVDIYARWNCGRSDLGELAIKAACETISTLVGDKTPSLFGTTPSDIQQICKGFSTAKGFGDLARDFFSRFTCHFIGYFLSREIPNHVGHNHRFANVVEHQQFLDSLELHCFQAARIIKDFSAGWYSKTHYQGGITPDKVKNYIHVALKKLRSEFARA